MRVVRFIRVLIGIWLLLSILGWIYVAVASARELTPMERAQVNEVADRAWPGNRCEHVHIIWTSVVVAPPTDLLSNEAVASGRSILAGYAYGVINGSCDVGVKSDLPAADACTTAVHEAGHLDGQEHGSSPVMGTADTPTEAGGFIDPTYVWPACQVMQTLTLDEAVAYMWERFPNSSAKCRRETPSRVLCIRATDHKHKRTRQVWRVWATTGGAKAAKIK
jgi:hypothetical protein